MCIFNRLLHRIHVFFTTDSIIRSTTNPTSPSLNTATTTPSSSPLSTPLSSDFFVNSFLHHFPLFLLYGFAKVKGVRCNTSHDTIRRKFIDRITGFFFEIGSVGLFGFTEHLEQCCSRWHRLTVRLSERSA